MSVATLHMPDIEELKEAMKKAQSPTETVQYLELVLFGKPKSGKTHFCGTLPRPLILDFDGGAAILGNKQKFPNFDGKVVRVESWKDVESWYWLLHSFNDRKGMGFKTVVWDTVTYAHYLAMDETKIEKVSRDPSKSRWQSEMSDYGKANDRVKFWVNQYKNLPLHKVWVCHEREDEAPVGWDEAVDEDDDELASWAVPDLPQGVRGFVMGLANLIGHQMRGRSKKTGKVVYLMAFDRPRSAASDRFGVMPKHIIDPTFEKLWSYYGKMTEEVNEDAGSDGE